MTRYPLLFGRRELVEGDGFVARVAVSGRALLTDEDGEFWVEGVNPGGFAASGKSPAEALAEFSTAFRTILFDIASDAPSFEAFREEVQRFFEETSDPALQEWEEASGAMTARGLPCPEGRNLNSPALQRRATGAHPTPSTALKGRNPNSPKCTTLQVSRDPNRQRLCGKRV